ncbi:hypothetical protein PspLS_11651 [Pyricularia sp. CBS 133598]|nr:hypothetical protein PspLS_11651 [Pyricularia sp. CBS 133598]
MFWNRRPKPEHVYTVIEDDESVGASSPPSPLKKQGGNQWRYSRLMPFVAWQVMLCVIMFLTGAIIIAASSPRHNPPEHQQTRPPSDLQCTEQLSVYSPLLDLVEYEHCNWTDPMAGSDSGYVGRLTKEMEKKWDAISQVSMVAIPYENSHFLTTSNTGTCTTTAPGS